MEEEQTKTVTNSAHVLVVPYPIQGHINPMLQFSKRLASKGLKVTLATISTYTNTLPPQSDPNPIQIQSINDGLKAGEKPENHETFIKVFEIASSKCLVELIGDYSKKGQPVKFIVYDCIIPWVVEVARKTGINGAPFFTQSAAVHYLYYNVYNGGLNIPVKGSVVSVPSMPLLKQDELPSFMVDDGYREFPELSRLNIELSSSFDEAKFLFFNSFDMLEEQLLKWMGSKWPIKTIGPTIPSLFLDKRLDDDRDYGLTMFKPETDVCIEWLNNRESGSVVYISMGSLASLGEDQMKELANGLIHTKKHFLWVVRASEETKLPSKLKTEVNSAGKGLIVNWCPQLTVLAHPAVGCFVTHSGWNSTLEAISLGVPMVALPQWTDQPCNAKHIAHVWKIGARVKVHETGIVTKDEIEACINEVMDGETGREFKSRIRKLKELAKEAVDKGGSSDNNIQEFATHLLNM